MSYVPPEAGIAEIARTMREGNIDAVPVTENNKLIGMITDRDLVVRGLANGAEFSRLSARDPRCWAGRRLDGRSRVRYLPGK